MVRFSITPPYGAATPSADLSPGPRPCCSRRGPAAGRAGPGQPARAAARRGVRVPGRRSGSRPQARGWSPGLLGQGDPAAGLLAEGTRRARGGRARRGPARASRRWRRNRPGPATRRAAFIAAPAPPASRPSPMADHTDRDAPRAASHPGARRPPTVTPAAGPGHSRPPRRSTPKIPTALAGTWSGTVRQTDPALAVTVQIQLAAGSPDGTIAYPQLGCSGRLLLVGAEPAATPWTRASRPGSRAAKRRGHADPARARRKLAFTFRRSGAGPAPPAR